MRNLINLILAICICLPFKQVFAEEPVVFSDVSAGVFRFQVKLAEHGNPEAQYKVGEMYEMGNGVSKDINIARTWYKKSAANGHKKANYKLLYIDIQSNGLSATNKIKIGELRQQSAAANPDAQYFLGKMYAAGVGVPKNLDSALGLLKKAKFNGIPEAEGEAIAVEEELARLKAKEEKKRLSALEASNKKKAQEEKKKAQRQKQLAKKRKEDAALARRKAQQQAESSRAAAMRKRNDEERQATARAKQKQAEEAKASAAAKKADKAAGKSKASFETDPCKGKKARFLSTCR